MKTFQILSMLTILFLVSSCGTGTSAPTSDVPCFAPTAWTEISRVFRFRFDGGNPDKLLFFHQSIEQREVDVLDGSLDLIPHDPIYRLDRITNVVDIVDDSVWDDGNSNVSDCINSNRESPFTTASTPEQGLEIDLLYADEIVEVEGGTFLRMYPATFSDSIHTQAVAVLSTDGSPGIPLFVFSIDPTGQHFHQLFSEVDGQPLGPPLRIGIGGPNIGGRDVCWALDNKFVIYAETSSGVYSNICVVDVEDEILSVSGN